MIVSIAGTGNVGTHLAEAFNQQGIEIGKILTRSSEAEAYRSAQLDSDVVLLAVSDSSISAVAGKFDPSFRDCIIAHTAGSIASTVLTHFTHYGVFYPLQTFTKGRPVNWSQIPILVTGSDREAELTLTKLASNISSHVEIVDDRARLILHLSATIANNFSNHMFALAQEIVEKEGLDFDLLRPLIFETALKVADLDPVDGQTGAARRNDQVTMQKHLDLLSNDNELSDLYKIISASIRKSATRSDV